MKVIIWNKKMWEEVLTGGHTCSIESNLDEKLADLRAIIERKDLALKGLLECDGGDLRSYRSHPDDEIPGSELFHWVPIAIQALAEKEKE